MEFFLDFFSDMSPSKLKSYAMIACLIGGILLYLGYQKQKQGNVLAGLAYSSINSALTGLVKIKGTVESIPGSTTYSPLSKTPAVWYSYTVEEFLDDEEGPDSYHTIDGGQSSDVFMLKDLSASCLVDPVDAQHVKVLERVWYESDNKPRSIPELGTHEANGGLGDYRFTETLILPGDELHIIGEASVVPPYLKDKQKDLSPVPNCLVKESQDGKFPLFFSNQNIDHLNQDVIKQSQWMMGGGILLLLASAAFFFGFISKGGK